MQKKIFILLFSFITCCSVNKTNVVGTYSKNNNQHLKDTLVLNKDGTYIRKLYNNFGSLVFKNTSKWTLKNDRIILKDFLKDDDDISYTEIEEVFTKEVFLKYQKFLMNVSLSVKRDNNIIYLNLNEDLNIYYERINKLDHEVKFKP